MCGWKITPANVVGTGEFEAPSGKLTDFLNTKTVLPGTTMAFASPRIEHQTPVLFFHHCTNQGRMR